MLNCRKLLFVPAREVSLEDAGTVNFMEDEITTRTGFVINIKISVTPGPGRVL